jgi:hypothetical protein
MSKFLAAPYSAAAAPYGPIPSANAYLLDAVVSFTYTGVAQTWTVPLGVTSVTLAGGFNDGGSSGRAVISLMDRPQ